METMYYILGGLIVFISMSLTFYFSHRALPPKEE